MSQIIKAGAIEKNMFLLVKGSPYLVVEREFVNPGKGSSFVRLKLKHLINGSTLQETYKTSENAEQVEVSEVKCQYLYSDTEGSWFMNMDDYDQFLIPQSVVFNKKYFLVDSENDEDNKDNSEKAGIYSIVFYQGKPIDIKLSPKMIFSVIESEEAVRGDTVSAVMKNVIVSTGLKVRVPAFIKVGEKIRINTETYEYVERVNK